MANNVQEFALKLKTFFDSTGISKLQAKMSDSSKIAKTIQNISPYKNMADSAKYLGQQLEVTKLSENSLNKSIINTKNSIANQSSKFNETKVKLAQLRAEYDRLPNKKLAKDIDKVVNSLDREKYKLNQLGNTLKSQKNQLVQNTEQIKKMGDAYEYANKKSRLSQFKTQSQEKIRNSMLDAYNAKHMAVSAVSTMGFLAEPIKEAMKFETVMSEVRKLVHFESPKELREFSDELKTMSTRVPMAVEGLGHIAAAAAQAGIAKKELLGFAEDAAHMAVAYNISAEQAGDSMAKWRAGFKLNQKEVVTLADQILTLSDNSAASGAQIGEVVTRIGALGKIAGMTEKEVAALAATSIGAGVAPEIAATGIKKMMTSLTSSTAMTKHQVEAMENLKINAVQLSKDIQSQGVKPMLDMLRKIKTEVPKDLQVAKLKNIFGEESIAPIAGIMNNLDEVEKNLVLVGDASKYADRSFNEFTIRSGTTANSLQLFHNNLSAIGITIGNTFLPAINQSIQEVNRFLNETVRPFIETHKESIMILGKFAAEVAIVVVAVSGAKAVISAFSAIAGICSATIKGLGGSVAWIAKLLYTSFIPATMRAGIATQYLAVKQAILNFVMNLNPVLKIISLLFALGAAIYATFKYWDDICKWVNLAWESLRGLLNTVKEVTGAIIDLFSNSDQTFKVNTEVNGSSNIDSFANDMRNRQSNGNSVINYNYTSNIKAEASDKDKLTKVSQQSYQEAQSNFTDMLRQQSRLGFQ